MYSNVYCSIIYNSQNMEATQTSIDRLMDKEAVVHLYNGILLYHKRNTSESVLKRQMDLEAIMQSEVSQKEKNKYCILTHIYGIWKDGTDESICRAAIETLTQRDIWTWGLGRKERVGCTEKVTWKLILPYEIREPMGICCTTQGTQTWVL